MEVYNSRGRRIPLAFARGVNKFISSTSPFYKALRAAKQYWDETSSKYNGSEDVMDVMKSFGYQENDELDAFIRFIMIDFEYAFTNIALLNYYSPNQDLTTFDKSESFVVDQRGFETVLQKFVEDNKISTILNTKVCFLL